MGEEKRTDVLLYELANAINTQEISTGKLMEELRGILATREREVIARLGRGVAALDIDDATMEELYERGDRGDEAVDAAVQELMRLCAALAARDAELAEVRGERDRLLGHGGSDGRHADGCPYDPRAHDDDGWCMDTTYACTCGATPLQPALARVEQAEGVLAAVRNTLTGTREQLATALDRVAALEADLSREREAHARLVEALERHVDAALIRAALDDLAALRGAR